MNLHVAHEKLMEDPAYRREYARLAKRELKLRAKQPDPVLSLHVEETPHWPIGRARDERDRLVARLGEMLKGRCAQAIDLLVWTPTLANRDALRREIARNTRAISVLRRLYTFACYVAAVESRATPPRKHS